MECSRNWQIDWLDVKKKHQHYPSSIYYFIFHEGLTAILKLERDSTAQNRLRTADPDTPLPPPKKSV